jgi:hypothetical protein
VPPLPPPLPPAERPVGQLVAEAIRLYGRRFWASLALGIGPALLNILVRIVGDAAIVVVPLVGGVVSSASLVGACLLAREERRRVLAAFLLGVVLFVPVPLLAAVFLLPALIWLAFVGLAVPVLVFEGGHVRAAVRRATRLARADFIHALGTLATLGIIVFITQTVLFFLLRGTGDQTLAIASFLASLIITPLLFLGAALLYFDQAAREDRKRVPQR